MTWNNIMGDAFKILLVEDTPVAQILCKKTINMIENTACDISDDGDKAIEARKTNDYDLILMDIGLPTVNGIDATKMIRFYEKSCDLAPITIIALTAHDDERTREECFAAGMNDFYTKPFTLEKAKEILHKHFI